MAVKWADEAEGGTWNNAPCIYLRLGPAVSDVGFDEERYAQPTATDDQIVTDVQQKTFTVTMRCESFDQDIASPTHAGAIMSTVRTRLMRPSSVFAPERWGIFSVLNNGKVNRLSYKSAGRQVTCYATDLLLSAPDVDVDTTVGAGGWIGDAVIAGTIKDTPGDISVSLDVDAR